VRGLFDKGGKTMMMESFKIRNEARVLLNNHWGTAVGTVFLMQLIYLGAAWLDDISLILSFIPVFIISGAIELGLAAFFINLAEKKDLIFEDAFSGFKNFIKALGVTFFWSLFFILWSLLLIIPGIIATIRYSQAYFILKDNPTISVLDTLKQSSEMMHGYKTDYFLLQLSFIGWAILCILSLGIGFLWLTPYIKTSNAIFYRELKKIRIEKESGKMIAQV